ncbi:hypothetical protein ACFWU5_16380 [Nocardia sp. NPDC058640]|uniref:hypothetical protein n=1 Tax=Nocardia sp. NPDC058640 TaxID=3346571 RepID=UPI0036500BA3
MADIEPGLFGPPPGWTPPEAVVPEDLSRGEKRQRLVERRIRDGIHPLGYIGLHKEAARESEGGGLRCGTCRHREVARYHSRSYPKCWINDGARATHGESSDIRAWWPACTDYQPTEEKTR